MADEIEVELQAEPDDLPTDPLSLEDYKAKWEQQVTDLEEVDQGLVDTAKQHLADPVFIMWFAIQANIKKSVAREYLNDTARLALDDPKENA